MRGGPYSEIPGFESADGGGLIRAPVEFLLFSRVSVIIAESSLLMPFAAVAFFSAGLYWAGAS